MSAVDWRNPILDEDVLREASPSDGRLILWVRRERKHGFQHWERISSLAGALVVTDQGMCSMPATSDRVRQRLGVLGVLWRFLDYADWRLPNGAKAEMWGDRRADLLLVWSEKEDARLDEEAVRARWPGISASQRIGTNLFVVAGVSPPAIKETQEAVSLPRGCPRAQAEQLLAAARAKGDHRAEATALVDLGIIDLREGDRQRALGRMEGSLAIALALGDRELQIDVRNQLGLAARNAGRPQRALEVLEKALCDAQAADDRYAEKMALFHVGLTYAAMNSPERALEFFAQALALARAVDDRRQIVELLWYMSIRHAELGQRSQAISRAKEVVNLLRDAGDPRAEWFDHHLQTYLAEESVSAVSLASEQVQAGQDVLPGPTYVSTSLDNVGMTDHAAGGPGLLRMAFTAASSMAQFLGSGLKGVSRKTYQKRLDTCASCEHHTGVRCRLCGCFTNVKAWMGHEECPAGKWAAGVALE